MPNVQNNGKRIILEFIDFIRFKIENDSLTMQEAESIAKTFMENLNLSGTPEDFARFYGQPRTNVSSVINRRILEKPVRRVFYPFNTFREVIPDKWKSHK